jgi:hypothetical protein
MAQQLPSQGVEFVFYQADWPILIQGDGAGLILSPVVKLVQPTTSAPAFKIDFIDIIVRDLVTIPRYLGTTRALL